MALTEHADALGRAGYLYPQAGRRIPQSFGHHNIGWEVSGDRRMRREYGTTDDLLDEIERTTGHVLLSSEDLGCSVHHHERFAELLARLRAAGLTIQAIVYLRNQADYAVSLYDTLVRLGFDVPFDDYLDALLDRGEYRWREWIFPFDYQVFLARLDQFDGFDVIVRSYEQASAASLIRDYLTVVGLDAGRAGIDDTIAANPRLPIVDALASFYRNRIGRSLEPSEHQALATFCALLGNGSIDLSVRSRQRINDRFMRGNDVVSKRHGLPRLDAVTGSTTRPADAPTIESLFSTDACRRLQEMTRMVSN
jgi:hypothetical protein